MQRRRSTGIASTIGTLFMAGGLILSLGVLSLFVLDRLEAQAMLQKIAGAQSAATGVEAGDSRSSAAAIVLPTPIPGVSPGSEAQGLTSGFGASAQASNGLSDGETRPMRIVIPGIGVDAPVEQVGRTLQREGDEQYYQWQLPSGRAAGWHEGSALLGQRGNTVLNGHNNFRGSIFRNLIDLEVGDEIVLYDAGQRYVYQVRERLILEEEDQPLSVRYENARFMLPTSDERLTIITCWPYTSISHRVVVIAVPGPKGDL